MRWRFVDKISSFASWHSAVGRKAVSLEEYSLLDPFGRKGVLPDLLILETCVELARWLVLRSSGYAKTCILNHVDRFAFSGNVGMGDVLRIYASVADRNAESVTVNCRVSCEDRAVAEGTFAVSLFGLAGTLERETVEAMWKELYGAS